MKTAFFYGLFMDADLLAEKGLHPQNIRLARLDGYQLVIGARATLAPKRETRSYGAIMDLESNELKVLYGGDGVEDYVPLTVQVSTMDGAYLDVITYILPLEKTSGSNSRYARHLAGVTRKLSLPVAYIEEIERWV